LASGLIDKLGGTTELEEANPRKRLGEPEDIAGVMLFLCSPAGSYMYVLQHLLFWIQVTNSLAEMALTSMLTVEWLSRLGDIRNYEPRKRKL
jgi:hypothetical protein